MNRASDVNKVIVQNLDALRKPGVLSARPGYEATGGWLTKKPAIVVTVERKIDDVAAQDRLPETLGGFPVDVREASPLQKMRTGNVGLFSTVVAAARPEMVRPTFDFEHDLTGKDLNEVSAAVAAQRTPKKPQLNYDPPSGTPLVPVEGKITITCHASPDAGWSTLKKFLSAVESTLTVGMYDFTSAHILDTVESVIAKKRLNLVLDHPAPNKTSDQSDDETYAALSKELDGKLKFAWALERMDPHAASWIFPNAYHIKVAVRDSAVFWLSSGNWNNSNQPDIDPVADPAGSAAVARKSDRDWHVIVESEPLAALFEKYLLNDLEVAGKHQVNSAALGSARSVWGQLATAEMAVAARTPKKYFSPKTITDQMKIHPLLTPDEDGYAVPILKLIQSAKTSLYMQTQYIHPSDDTQLAALIQAIVQRIEEGVDVRLICSQYETLDYLEKIQDAGIDLCMSVFKVAYTTRGLSSINKSWLSVAKIGRATECLITATRA